MKTTSEIISRVFAQYIGANVKVENKDYLSGGYTGKILGVCTVQGLLVEHPQGSDGHEPVKCCKLILKPLSAITDEDAIEVTKIEISREDFEYESWENPQGLKVIKSFPKGERGSSWYKILCIGGTTDLKLESCQYLISKGYDMTQYLLGGKTLEKSGLAIYENELVKK